MREENLEDVHVTTIRIETHNDYRKFLLHQSGDCISMSREQLVKAIVIVAAQQGMHWTLGILRDLQAAFWLRLFPALRRNPNPPQRQ